MYMPWGKYKGWPLFKVPAGYLAWVAEVSNADWTLKYHAVREIASRFDLVDKDAHDDTVSTCDRCESLRGELDREYRTAALVCHPDRGGTTATMQALNGMVGRLRLIVRN